MPACSFCPGRSFVDDDAVRMHKDSRHWWCQSCDRLFSKEEHLDQHNSAKHAATIPCDECDKRFKTRQALDQHVTDKHPPLFECEYCDKEFTTDEGRLAHENAEHPPMFECEYCDKEFTTDEGRLAHEKAKHPPTYDCNYCDREFTSEEARTQHEYAQHTHVCNLCDKSFASPQALQQHKETKKHVQCSECSSKFHTQDGLNAHKKACHTRPLIGTVFPAFSRPSVPSNSSLSNDARSTRNLGPQRRESSALTHSERNHDGTETAPGSDTSSSGASSADDEDLSTSRNGTPTPQEGAGDGIVVEQSCACSICQRSSESCVCSICQRASPVLSKTGNPVEDGAGSIIPADPVDQDDSAVERQVRCPSCFNVVDAKEGLGDHICAPFENIVPLHCPFCYTQFADQSSLEEHLEEGRRSFLCQLCTTPCCSTEMLQEHLLSHPACGRCGEFFADDSSLCKHVGSEHPVVVCWDCDGAVVEQISLELHYTESPAHPSCPFCEIGKRNLDNLDEHIKNDHATIPEIAVFPEVGDLNASLDREAEVVQNLSDGSDLLPSLSLPREISLSISSMPPQTQQHAEAVSDSCVVNVQEPLELAPRRDASPSPTPSEHGSNGSRSRLPTRNPEPMENVVVHDVSGPQSPVSSILAESFSDISSPTSSCRSVVYVSADGIPDYVRENRAYLVATSAASLSSGCTPLRLPSTYSLESLELSERHEPQDNAVLVSNVPGPSTSAATHRLHCRICLRDPCEDMTATICGHIFCKQCITQAVVSKSECPVCKSATLLYCLFKLDLSA